MRPARLAVSSPNASAATPCEISCRMIDGITTAKKISWTRDKLTLCSSAYASRTPSTASTTRSLRRSNRRKTRVPGLALRRAVDAVAGGRLGLEPGGRDGLAAVFAKSVRALLKLGQGPLDLTQGLPERGGQGLGLPPLRRDLARIGEIRVVLQPGVALRIAELGQLVQQVGPLLLEESPQVGGGRVGGHRDQRSRPYFSRGWVRISARRPRRPGRPPPHQGPRPRLDS